MLNECHVKVPGKLLITGEYAVLEPHQLSVVTSVSRFVTVTVTPSDSHKLNLPNLGIENLVWGYKNGEVLTGINDSRLKFIKRAIGTVFAYLEDAKNPILNQPFKLSVVSELDEETTGKKYGLGSSAAVTVGIVKALLQIVGEFPEEIIFKIAATAHFLAQGSGAGADIAASTFGGLIQYTSFYPKWLSEQLNNDRHLKKLIDDPWPYFSWRRLKLPENFYLCVGWTKSPAGTGPLVKRINEFKTKHPGEFDKFLSESTQAVTDFIKGLETEDYGLTLKGMKMNRSALVKLGAMSGVPIETPSLQMLADLANACGGAGKSSGAGGGDCGIALVYGTSRMERLFLEWKKVGIEPLQLFESQ